MQVLSSLLDRRGRVVVVVRAKGTIKVVDLGGVVLYIFTVPAARLTALEMRVGLRLHPDEAGDSLKRVQATTRDPEGTSSLERRWGNAR